MKLHSKKYLNPFQPFPERGLDNDSEEDFGLAAGTDPCTIPDEELDNDSEERPTRPAIEDNLSRAVFSALANAENPHALATFVEQLAKHAKYGSHELRNHIQTLAAVLRGTDSCKVEVGLQTWRAEAVKERSGKAVYLIGISSCGDWDNQREAPFGLPRPDAWVYVPEKMLLVFEFKKDEPLDATQVSAYIHALRFPGVDGIPRAEPGSTLTVEQALAVQKACENLVLDADWFVVIAALEKHIQEDERVGSRGRWLSGQAAEYIRSHVRTSYPSQVKIVDAILGAYPYNEAGNGLTAERQIELLRMAFDAKLSDGSNAFPAMHGRALHGDAGRIWDGGDRTRRMNDHVDAGKAKKVSGKYMLAEGVTPTQLGVLQAVVDSLAEHKIIEWYDINKLGRVVPPS
jgi:hypothetical protein